MRRTLWMTAAILVLAAGAAPAADLKQMSVTVKQTEVRATPGTCRRLSTKRSLRFAEFNSRGKYGSSESAATR